MPSKTVFIPNISCAHCVMTVEREVGEIEGVISVTADQERQQATIEWGDPATWQQVDDLLKEIEYPAQELVMPS